MKKDIFRLKTAVVFRHVMFEDLGTLAVILRSRNYQVIYVDIGVDNFDKDFECADLLIVLGGPIGVNDDALYPFLVKEIEFVRKRLACGLAILGICLGAQMIAKACGASVKPMTHKEIGFYPITMTKSKSNIFHDAINDEIVVLHWHGDTFELPSNANHLVSSESCANQAFSIGNNVLALQFHLEVDCQHMEQWLIGHALELSQSGLDHNLLRSQAIVFSETIKQQSELFFSTWLDVLERCR